MIRRTLALLSISAASFAAAQTPHMPNAIKIGNEGITITSIPSTAVVQFGTNAAPGNWTAPVSLSANALPLLVSFAGSSQNISLVAPKGDPDPGVLKEIDAQEGPNPYDVKYTDASGNAQVLHVPALPSTTAPLVPPTPGTVYPLVVSNIQPISGSAAIPVMNLFQVQPYLLVGGVLSNFSWNVTINGTTLNCTYGSMSTTGTTTMSCIVPAPAN